MAAPAEVPQQWITLGSVDEDLKENPYRMLVTLGNRGAALARIELSSDRYRDLEDRSGYLGHLVMDDKDTGPGCLVQVVGAGTPADKAGVKVGDRIMKVRNLAKANSTANSINGPDDLEKELAGTRPRGAVELTVQRSGKPLPEPLTATLTRRPLEVVRPELKMPQIFTTTQRHTDAIHLDKNAPLSLLATIQQIRATDAGDKKAERIPEDDDPKTPDLEAELDGIDLRNGTWNIVRSDQTQAVFRKSLPKRSLEITKTYRLAEVPKDARDDADSKAYHIEVEIAIRNTDKQPREVAYRLEGPNGLPREGAWYAIKVSQTGSGLRDVVFQRKNSGLEMIGCTDLADNGSKPIASEEPFRFLGVDAQYFSTELIPDQETAARIDQAAALRVGQVDPQGKTPKTITNTSFRIVSKPVSLNPGEAFSSRFDLFAGPKRPPLLAKYDLGNLIYYGWFYYVAEPMASILHFFYAIVRNYGLAIIMLTVLVRLCMFPLSRKQAQNAQMMQKLQPEIKKIQEKYKKDREGGVKAQQELFRKHNYNPLGGCLLLFIQMPIFIGLYRSLQVDIELRDAPLLAHAIRWCSNLAAPDMLFNWSGFMPDWVNNGVGMLGLGPFFNLLPLVTIALFIVQQKMFMPPPADEQAALQQKMMNFMMIFMGILFYKVGAGLCIYFVASSLWGIAERKFLPKTIPAAGPPPQERGPSGGWLSRLINPPEDNGSSVARRKKKRGKK